MAATWTAIGLLAATLAVLATALFQIRGEFRSDFLQFRSELRGDMAALRSELQGDMAVLRSELRGDMAALRSELRGELGELTNEVREGFRAQGARIDVLAARVDAHVDRHAS